MSKIAVDLSTLSNPLALSRGLLSCASVTPADDGALDMLQAALEHLGFACFPVTFAEDDGPGKEPIKNLYARRGAKEAPNLCFAGHTDVVPVGKGWSVEPFAAQVVEGRLYGRGAADMKTAIACFTAAVARLLESGEDLPGTISFLITGDEEGLSVNGTKKLLPWITEQGEKLSACVVGEPTNPRQMGDMIKIGRRGSVNFQITAFGTQGHAAYPHLADNPIPRLMDILAALTKQPLDQGTDHFQPSTLALTTFDVGNPAENVIPAQATAGFNIRFNDLHSGASLIEWVENTCTKVCGGDTSLFEVKHRISGESFLTPPGLLSNVLSTAIEAETGRTPELSTSGGTSDARFIKDYCPVAEFGLVGQSMHKADENVDVADLETLTRIYQRVIIDFFRAHGAQQ